MDNRAGGERDFAGTTIAAPPRGRTVANLWPPTATVRKRLAFVSKRSANGTEVRRAGSRGRAESLRLSGRRGLGVVDLRHHAPSGARTTHRSRRCRGGGAGGTRPRRRGRAVAGR